MRPASNAADEWPAEVTLTRVFAAPRDVVFRIWTDPKYVALWWGVDGSSNPTVALDVRPGGRWRIDMRAPDGTLYKNGGVYLEVVSGERLVSTDESDPVSPAWRGKPPADRLNTVTFADEGAGTRVTLRIEFRSTADRDLFVRAGVREGIGQSLDRLARVLAGLAPPST